MRSLFWAVPIAVFFLNPTFACGPAEPQYQYGAAEMRAAVEGNWSFTITPQGGPAAQVTVHLSQSATVPAATSGRLKRMYVRSAYACGSRTLVKSAGACIDESIMPLDVTYVSGDASLGTILSGTFMVPGTTFDYGSLTLTVGPYHVNSDVNSDGSLGFSNAFLGSGGATATLTVSRS
jgi:hypothetical protein